jgi:hypothetical protein
MRTAAGIALCFSLARAANGQTPDPTPALLNDRSPEAVLALLREATKYPPDTSPLTVHNWDLLHPWTVDTPSLPMMPSTMQRQLDSLRNSGLSEEEMVRSVGSPSSFPRYQFEVNKLILAGTKDELNARLIVSPPRGSTEATPRIRIVKTELIGDDAFGSPNLGSVRFSCEKADQVCTFRWRAPSEEKRYWGALELLVTVAVEGKKGTFVARQGFYSSPMMAGTFTGGFRERLDVIVK